MSLSKERKQEIFQEYGLNTGDTGSADVQVALLTEKINALTEHCKQNAKDFSSRRGLLQMVCNRRSLLDYIARHDQERYKNLVKKLGLRR